MRALLLTFLMGLVGCATKYVVPSNRFITPETNGGMLRGQFEVQATTGHQMKIDTSQGTVDEGVIYSEIPRTGYRFSTSLFDSMDFVWSHIGGGNSMVGPKLQILGASRTGKGTGHKLAFGYFMGANEHETDDESIQFKLEGKELLLSYGYRISENVLPYGSFSLSSYKFTGSISSPVQSLDGLEPTFETKIKQLNGGVDLSWEAFFMKFELSYQQISTTDSPEKTAFLFGFATGVSW